MNLISFIFPKLRTLKTWLDNCLKRLVSDDPFTRNIINVSKHCWNLHHSTFIIFLSHYQRNWVGKSLSYWYAKSWDCLLTHWLPMKNIVLHRDNITTTIQTQLSQKQKAFSQFFAAFFNRAQTLLRCASQHLYHIDWVLSRKFCSKKSLLLTCEVLGLLANTLATDEKYPVLHRDNLTTTIQMQLSQKQKDFSQFSVSFLKSRLNFKHFETKDEPHRFCISEVTDSENIVGKLCRNSCFRRCFEKQYGNCA